MVQTQYEKNTIAIARALCIADGNDPDGITNLGFLGLFGPRRTNWTGYISAAEAAQEVLNVETEELRSLLKSWITTYDMCSITTGECCCGNPVENHGFYDNHYPVDSGWYYAQSLYTETKEALGE